MGEPHWDNELAKIAPESSALENFERWNPEAIEVVSDLLRSLRRKKGFGLFFVQCSPAQGQQVMAAIRERFPKKRLELFELTRESETLYPELLERYQVKPFEIACVTGVEKTLYEYEDTKRLAGWSSKEIYNYSWKGLPPLLSHLNRQRETFEAKFPSALIFLVPSFVIDYFVQRAPDFFDWRSGFFRISEPLEDVQNSSKDLLGKKYQEYLDLTPEQRIEKILEIKDKVLQIDSSDHEKRSNLLREQGRLFQSGKDYGHALDCYDFAVKVNPNNFKAWNSKGRTLWKLDRHEESIECFDHALKIKPNHSYIWKNRGDALRITGKYEEALKSYEHALEKKPKDVEAWNKRGLVLINLEFYEKAILSFDAALEIEEGSNFLWFYRGYSLERLSLTDESIENYKKALEVNPKDYLSWYRIGLSRHIKGQYREAIKSYKMALEINPKKYWIWNNCAYSFRRLKEYEEALSSIEKSLEIEPNSSRAWLFKAFILEEMQCYNKSLEAYDMIGELQSENFFDWLHQAYGMYYAGDNRVAVESFEKAIQLGMPYKRDYWITSFSGFEIRFKSSPAYLALYGLGLSFFKLRRYKQAFLSLRKFFMSIDLYRDGWKIVSKVSIAIFQGKLSHHDLDDTVHLWLRHFGFRR